MQLLANNNQTMSSREIAKLTGKRHADVIRDIRLTADNIKDDAYLRHELNQGLTELKDDRDYTKEFILSRFMTELLITGYDVLRRAKVLHRLVELEQKEFDKKLHVATRQDSKTEYKAMGFAVKEAHDEIKPYHFSNEADLINRIVFGMTASKFRKHHDVEKGELIRDYMTSEQLDCIVSLQRANTVYIEDGLSFDERKTKLTNLFDRKHKQKLINEIHKLEA